MGVAWQKSGKSSHCITSPSQRLDIQITSVSILTKPKGPSSILTRSLVAGGPNSPISNGSLISGLEAAIDYAYRCITKMQTENIMSMEPTVEAMEDFLEHRDACMDLMVWSDPCKSWFVVPPCGKPYEIPRS